MLPGGNRRKGASPVGTAKVGASDGCESGWVENGGKWKRIRGLGEIVNLRSWFKCSFLWVYLEGEW